MFEYYAYHAAFIVVPISYALLSFGAFVAYRVTRRISALVQAAGFLLVLLGNLFVNFGPTETTVADSGESIVAYTQLFSVGFYLGQIGIIVVAVAFVVFSLQSRAIRAAR